MPSNVLSNTSVTPQPAPEASPKALELPSPLADVAQGAVPAITLDPISEGNMDPLQDFVVQNFDALAESGLDYHEILDTQQSVLFNPAKITAEQIDEAAAAGKLFEIAPIAKELGKPVGGASAANAAPAAAAGPLAGVSVAVPGNSRLESTRLKNVAPAPKNAPNPVPNQLGRRAV